jgi:hypothetical protein
MEITVPQTLAHYSRILMAIREAKEIGRLPDLLTNSRIGALMEVHPKKESNYWRQEQMGVRPNDLPVAFYSFVRARALELGSNAASTRVARDDIDEQEATWEGPCVLGDLCGGSHAPERCSLFVDLAPEDCLVVIQRKQLCYLCFRHADSQPCKSQSLPACSVGGCVRMHSKLLYETLQKEETRAIVIEVEEGPEDRPAGCEGPQTGNQGLSRRGSHYGQHVLLTISGCGWQYPGDRCVWSGQAVVTRTRLPPLAR